VTKVGSPQQYKNAATRAAVKWAKKNPEKVREYKRRYKHRHAERVKHGEWDRDNRKILKRLVTNAKSRAKKRGIEFTITESDLTLPAFCPVLGVPFVRERGKWRQDCPSIDRIDPLKGYVPGNVQVISKMANTMKSNAQPHQLRAFAQWVVRTYGEQGD